MLEKTVFLLSVLAISVIFTGCNAAGAQSGAGDKAVQGVAAITDQVEEIYGISMDENAAVITDTVADVYTEPDIKSERITQALYNQPVHILEEKGGWVRVDVIDGGCGWIRSKYIDRNIASIHGRDYIHRIIITSREKSIFSQPSGGITIKNAVMGTEFFAFNYSGDAYEVYLPCNATGWLRGSGIIHVALDDTVSVTRGSDFVSTAMKFKGTSYLLKGTSSMGMDSQGLVYICARINGINLPGNIERMLKYGTEIKLEDAAAGDLIFFTSGRDVSEISFVAICTGSGNYIYASKTAGYVKIGSMKEENIDGKPYIVRRIFMQ